MNSSNITRCLEIVRDLKNKGNPDNLTKIEHSAMHLMRELGFLYVDHGPNGTDTPVIRSYSDTEDV